MNDRYYTAVMNDKEFKKNTKVKPLKTGVKQKEDISLFQDTHATFKPLWDEYKKDEIEPDQSTLKGKALLKKVYQSGGNKTNQILNKVLKNDSAVIKHLEGHINEGDGDEKDVKQSKMLKSEIKDVAGLSYTPASKIPKTDPIWKYSNPLTAQKQATKLKLGTIYRSTNKDKKYQILTPDGKWVHFGQMGYEDFTKHLDQERRENYLKRASGMKGDWRTNPYSANALAMRVLW